jgi:D-alanyl-D-alanine carboxypeptidase (penicillin-binding protein 5/6)
MNHESAGQVRLSRRLSARAARPLAGGVAACLALSTPLATGLTPVLASDVAASGAAASHALTIGGPQLAGRGVIVNYPAGSSRHLPKVPASAYVIADAGTGQVLAAKDPHGKYLPASTLKILTADALMPVLKPDQEVVASRRAADVTPSKVGLIQGHSYQVSDLFKALLMISANDAAIALAQATGSFDRGVAMMNAEARRLQADDTVAKRPNGLDEKGQHVSAYDEALFARQALSLPTFLHDEGLRIATFPVKRHHKPVKLWNQNEMLSTYRGDLGGKIGWTTKAKTTFIGWARRGGHTLIVTMLHCRPLVEMTYAARLLNWGFAMDGKVKPVGALVRPLPTVVAKAHHAAAPRQARPVARLAGPSGLRDVPLAAGLGALGLVVLTAGTVLLLTRRRGTRGKPAE